MEAVQQRRDQREEERKKGSRHQRRVLLRAKEAAAKAVQAALHDLERARAEESRARRETARARKRAEEAAEREAKRADSLSTDNIIETGRRREREVMRARGGLRAGPGPAERRAREYGAAKQAQGCTPANVKLRALRSSHVRQLFTPRDRACPERDSRAMACTDDYDAFVVGALAVDPQPRRFHLHVGAGCFGTGRGLVASKGLGSVEVGGRSQPINRSHPRLHSLPNRARVPKHQRAPAGGGRGRRALLPAPLPDTPHGSAAGADVAPDGSYGGGDPERRLCSPC